MKRIKNFKRFISLVVSIACLFAIATIPSSALAASDEMQIFTGAKLEYLGEAPATRTISNLVGDAIIVYPAIYQNGSYSYLPDVYEYNLGPGYTPFNCSVSDYLYEEMAIAGWNYFIVEYHFTVSGTNLYKAEAVANGNQVLNSNFSQPGSYSFSYVVPAKYHTYSLTITDKSLNTRSIGGHIG